MEVVEQVDEGLMFRRSPSSEELFHHRRVRVGIFFAYFLDQSGDQDSQSFELGQHEVQVVMD